MANVHFEITAGEAKAVQAWLAVERAEKRVEAGARQAGQAQKKGANDAARSLQVVKSTALGVLSALGMTAGIAGAVSTIVRLVGQWREGMAALSREIRTAANESVALAMMQEGGKARERVVEAGELGAQYGVRRAESYNIVQALQAQTGSWETGKTAAREVFKLVGWHKLPAEEALTAVSGGVGLRMKPALAARLPYAAGEVSAKGAAELVNVAPAMGFYRDVKGGAAEAYGIAARLSETTKAEKLEVYTRAVAIALTTRKGKWGKFVGGLRGAEENDIYAMLQDLAGRGITTPQQLEAVGLGEIRQKKALSDLLADPTKTMATAAAVRKLAGVEGLLGIKRTTAEGGYPELAHARVVEKMEAVYAAEAGLPTTRAGKAAATTARRREIIERARATAMQRHGLGWLVGEDKRVGWWAWQRAQLLVESPTPSEIREAGGAQAASMATEAQQIAARALQEAADSIKGAAKDLKDATEKQPNSDRGLD